MLIINADDWGQDRATTDRITDCAALGTVSCLSAMVFMADSRRAASIVDERQFDVGLHLNLTAPFTEHGCPERLVEHQAALARYLKKHRLAQALFHPGLVASFDYVVKAQLDEYQRLYGELPGKIDGHHHMHLSANVLLQGLLPRGSMLRRNFSFQPGEKSAWNRMYRQFVDGRLARRYRLADYFFSLFPLETKRIERILSLAREFVVEVETHPVVPEEYRFLMGDEILHQFRNIQIAPARAICR